jgi:hypothetical protein
MEFYYYVYIFRVKETGKVIYVGSTRTIGGRINEHRRSMREKNRRQPIHKYLIANHLELIKDVEICVIDYAHTKDEGLKLESYYYHKYAITALNVWDANERTGKNSPVRKALKTADGKHFFNSQREAAKELGTYRQAINQMVKRGEIVQVELPGAYVNEETGEQFSTGGQVQHLFNLDSKSINRLAKEGSIIVNGMTIRKV